jgi:anti-anti-sigma regulatory factor
VAEGLSKFIDLPAVVDLDAIDDVRDKLIEAIDAGPVTVSGARVERVSTNALLMLISAAETARRNSYSFVVTRMSEPMQSAIARLGLMPSFAGMMKG